MTEEKTKKLLNRFSFFHPEKPITEGLMVFGFEHGDGWFDIIWELCEKIEEDLKQTTKPIGSEIEDFEVIQVKEKFGTLRFYTNWGTNKIYNFIEQAEIKSAESLVN